MRVNLITQASAASLARTGAIPLSLTIKPACGLPGDYEYSTDSSALMQILHQRTDLPAAVIERFSATLYAAESARLLGVELSERVLTDIGYFID